MDDEFDRSREDGGSDGGRRPCGVFRWFVCVALSALLALHAHMHVWPQASDTPDEDLADVKYVVMSLTKGLSELNHKHEHLHSEISRISAVLPAVAAAAGRARDALEPAWRRARSSLDVHDYDRQIIDFALESAGARILDTGDTVAHVMYESVVTWSLHVLVSWVCRDCEGARAMLQPSTLPGECWAFKGARGEAVVRLLGTVVVTGVSLEHISPHISPTKEISAAPRVFMLEGMEHRSDQYAHNFGKFEYQREGKPIQYFEVTNPTLKGYELVRFRVLTNWGHPVYTCVYRLRVHGELVEGQAPQPVEEYDTLVNDE